MELESKKPSKEFKCSYDELSHYKDVDTKFKGLTYWLLGLLILAGWITALCFIILWYEETYRTKQAPVIIPSPSWMPKFSHAAVAMDNGLCSEIGRNIMMKGGNAMDSALASLICDGIMNPFSMGLGGGFFMVNYNSIYVNPKTGDVYKYGDKINDFLLASTMKRIADSKNPVELLYKGDLAVLVTKEIQDRGGFLSLEDLTSYSPRIYSGYKTKLGNGLVYCSLDLPSAGPAVAAYLQMMNNFDINSAKPSGSLDESAKALHRMIESLKLIYSMWVNFADSDDPELIKLVNLMSTPSFGEHLASQIPEFAHSWKYYEQKEDITHIPERIGDTAHISVVDQSSNAVSVTSSLNYFFGAMVRSPSTGIIWNNHMADFIPRDHENANNLNKIIPGKRPRSAMVPVIIYDEKAAKTKLVLGAAGGSRILGTVATVASRILYLNDTIKQAIDMPRFYISIGEDGIQVDEKTPKDLIDSLKKLGHDIKMTKFESKAQAIFSDGTFVYANTDFRKPSYPAGF